MRFYVSEVQKLQKDKIRYCNDVSNLACNFNLFKVFVQTNLIKNCVHASFMKYRICAKRGVGALWHGYSVLLLLPVCSRYGVTLFPVKWPAFLFATTWFLSDTLKQQRKGMEPEYPQLTVPNTTNISLIVDI